MKKYFIRFATIILVTMIPSSFGAITYPIYVWNNMIGDSYSNSDNWGKLDSQNDQELGTTMVSPTNQNTVYIGYSFYYQDKQVFTPSDTKLTITEGGDFNELFLGDNVIYWSQQEISNKTVHLGLHSVFKGDQLGLISGNNSFDFGSMSGDAHILTPLYQGNITTQFLGNTKMTSDQFIYTFLKATNLLGMSTWDITNIIIQDKFGNNLSSVGTITDPSTIKEGEFGLFVKNENGESSVNLIAKGNTQIPESSTATLTILGLTVFLLRRRRK
ncbi:MAG: PEP-CTERM sorting domain-containing protein [Akkermansia sp.]